MRAMFGWNPQRPDLVVIQDKVFGSRGMARLRHVNLVVCAFSLMAGCVDIVMLAIAQGEGLLLKRLTNHQI